MTKAELIERIARSRDLPPEISKKCIAEILDIAFGELSGYFARAKITRAQTPRFSFPGFGTFTKKQRSARRGVNPRTLEPMEIEACETLDFKPSTELRRAMNRNRRSESATGKTESRKAVADKPKGKGRRVAGPNGRMLERREDELDLPAPDSLLSLPDAPLRKVGRGRKSGSAG